MDIKERIENSINFLRSAYFQATKMEGKTFPMDAETIKILLILLKDVKMYVNCNQK